MNKKIAFVLTIACLHLLSVLAVMPFGGNGTHAHGLISPFAKFLLSPVYYPLRGVLPALVLIPANSILWGLMAERLVFGRKTVWRRRAAKQ